MEAYSTLLLTSGPAIQHILENGNVVDLPGDVTFICEVSNTAMANSLGTVKFALIDLIRIFEMRRKQSHISCRNRSFWIFIQ